ncbi:MAG TPA: hypothetical protein VGM26_07205 [Rhizomicrobium sp.]|jgi:hypothetical protein
MKKAAILAILMAVALPALAGEEPKPGAKEAGAKGGKPGTNVEMPYLMAPLTNADGKLTGYVYITSRLTAASEAAALTVRAKLAFIQDAFVRDVNGEGVATADDPEKVDIAAAEARLLADAQRVMGAGQVKSITVCRVQITELHPVRSPNAPPEASSAGQAQKNPEKSRCLN